MPAMREQRAARRAERDGSGPVRGEGAAARNPGATVGWALFGETLTAGVLIALVGLAVITLPVGLAAGVRHLRRFVAGEDSRLALFWADVRRALLPGSLIGICTLLVAGILIIDIDLARSGALPGGAMVEVVGWLGLAALGMVLLGSSGAWSPELGWGGALRALPAELRADLPGALYLIATAGFVVVATWALFPLVVPALGCAALAVVAVPHRRRR